MQPAAAELSLHNQPIRTEVPDLDNHTIARSYVAPTVREGHPVRFTGNRGAALVQLANRRNDRPPKKREEINLLPFDFGLGSRKPVI